MTEEKALGIDAVFACVNLYARTLASMPLLLYEKTPDGKRRAVNHPLYRLLHNEPNPNMTSHNFRKIMEASLKLWGNAYAWIEFDNSWRVKYLWPLLPGNVFPQRSLQTGELFYDAVLYNGESAVFALMKWCIFLDLVLTVYPDVHRCASLQKQWALIWISKVMDASSLRMVRGLPVFCNTLAA